MSDIQCPEYYYSPFTLLVPDSDQCAINFRIEKRLEKLQNSIDKLIDQQNSDIVKIQKSLEKLEDSISHIEDLILSRTTSPSDS